MDAKAFLAEFGHIAAAPGGVQRLREMIYNLAVTGDLTPQFPGDGNAQNLLYEIGEAKTRLIARKAFKRSPKLEGEPIAIPANIRLPANWCWTRLVDIGEINPKNEAADDSSACFVPMSGIPQLHGKKVVAEIRPWEQIKKGFPHFANGDVVLAKITPCFENGKAAFIAGLPSEIGAGTTELHVVRPLLGYVEPGYIYVFLRSPYFAVEGERNMTGTAGQKRLPTEYFATRAFPLPPLPEQKRIVAKVDELMALCDKLEALQQQREKFCQLVGVATIEAITIAQSPADLLVAWQRLRRELPLLASQSRDLEALRNAILDLAAQGKLTQPRAGDSPASDLLAVTQASRSLRISAGEVRTKRSAPTDIKLVESAIPSHWVEAPIEDLFQFIDYRGQTPIKTSSGRVLVTAKNVRPGKIAADPVEYIAEGDYAGWMTRGFPREGDLLITTEAPLGNVARIEGPPDFALAQRVIDLQPYAELNTRYVMYFMMSPSFQKLLWANATGTTAKGIKAAKLKRLPLSVPPIEEQDRIVSRVENLLSICSALEAQLAKAKSTAEKLARACTSAITGIRIEDKEDMKAPKTELVSRLRLGVSPTDADQAPLAAILIRNQGELSAKTLWQMSGLEIDDFYRQLATEMARGWIVQPEVAYVREVAA